MWKLNHFVISQHTCCTRIQKHIRIISTRYILLDASLHYAAFNVLPWLSLLCRPFRRCHIVPNRIIHSHMGRHYEQSYYQ